VTLLAQISRHAALGPHRPALLSAGRQLDYAGLLAEVGSAVQQLRGLTAQVVAIDLENGPAWVVLDIAALQLGVCLVPLPPFFSPAQLDHVMRLSGAAAVLSDDPVRLRQRIGALLQDDGLMLHIAGQAVCRIATSDRSARRNADRPAAVDKITFTSGTTGRPKGVMLSWAQMRPVVTSLVAAAGMSRDDRHLVLMPLAVLLENIGGVYVALWAGAAVVLAPPRQLGMQGSSQLDGRRMAAALAEARATTTIFTPQTLQGLVEAIDQGAAEPPRLRFAAVGGAPVSARLLQRAADAGLAVYQGYGLSECCSVVCLNTASHNRPGSAGRALPHAAVRIADDGEVVVGGQSFIGYLGEAPRAMADWHTGDLGELDADGYLYLHGRRRNVFITAFGRNVAPEWVESELTLEPAIAQAAVFGEARPYNVALIVAAPGASAADVEAALARTNRDLPDYARVARWLAADAAFSVSNGLLTGTGRLCREPLLQRYALDIESLYREVQTS